MAVIRQFADFTINNGVDQNVIGVLYLVTELPHDNPSAALDPPFPQLHDAATSFGLPWPNAQCLFQRVLRRIDEASLFAMAIFVDKKTFSFGPQPSAEWYRAEESLSIPVISAIRDTTGAVIPGWHVLRPVITTRPTTFRVKQSFRVGDEAQADIFASQIEPNIGLLYGFPLATIPNFGRLYQLAGFSMVRYANNQIIITYRFRTNAAIAALAPIAAIGLDVALPALNGLDGYVPVMNGPSVTVAAFGTRNMNGAGGPLP